MPSSDRWTAVTQRCVVLLLPLVLTASPARGGAPAVVVRVNGAPTVERAGQSQPLRPADAVGTGDVVVTDAAAKVQLVLADDSVLTIGPRSRLVLDELLLSPTSRRAKLRVLAGRFKLAIAKFFGATSAYEVRTPTALAGVRGTVVWGDTTLDAICVLDGHADVRALSGSGTPAQLTAGQCVNQMAAGKTERLAPSPADLAAYLKEVTLD